MSSSLVRVCGVIVRFGKVPGKSRSESMLREASIGLEG
jgi:hypothetical protein